jgi:hypothetical protein
MNRIYRLTLTRIERYPLSMLKNIKSFEKFATVIRLSFCLALLVFASGCIDGFRPFGMLPGSHQQRMNTNEVAKPGEVFVEKAVSDATTAPN